MKPKSRQQQQIISLSKTLAPINDKQKAWGYKHCLDHIAHRTKKGILTCMECAHTWTDKDATEGLCTCPHCGAQLTIQETRRWIFREIEYFCIVTTCKGYQVLRFFYLTSLFKKGNKAEYTCTEVVQRWITPEGKFETVALLRGMCFMYNDVWNFGSKLEIRPNRDVYNIYPAGIYPYQHTIEKIKRNGFKGDFHDMKPFDMFHLLLTDNKAETLLKTGQYSLLLHYPYLYNVGKYWSAIKICFRNQYHVKDASMWCDYIDLLEYFKIDIHNAKNVCPINLHEEHDKLTERKKRAQDEERRRIAREQELERRKKLKKKIEEMQENNKAYILTKSKFFDIDFTDGTIHIQVLKSVQEFYEEGQAMHHCVFSNEYYTKPDSLILSARINNQRIETIEISLKTMEIIQSRGACNKDTEFHHTIIKLVRKNMKAIRKRLVA